jgi:hypothetical protein
LDAVYPKVLTGSWLALIKPNYEELYRVDEATASSRTDFGLSTKTSRILLDTNENLSTFPLRDTVVLAQSELLEVAKAPVLLPVFGDTIELDEEQPELKKDQHLIIRGQLLKQVQVTARERFVKTVSSIEPKTDGLSFHPDDGTISNLQTGGNTICTQNARQYRRKNQVVLKA